MAALKKVRMQIGGSMVKIITMGGSDCVNFRQPPCFALRCSWIHCHATEQKRSFKQRGAAEVKLVSTSASLTANCKRYTIRRRIKQYVTSVNLVLKVATRISPDPPSSCRFPVQYVLFFLRAFYQAKKILLDVVGDVIS